MKPITEIIRENLTPTQVLAICQAERAKGRFVNVNRLHSQLVEIEIIHPNRVIDVTPSPRYSLETR
ncbi:hypothetical protein [Thiolinea disciformis]|uniref:hypothetical protein n=1 Tax=Thiolinea disciformis TaxID=125614 RepID=UPI000399974C|nr:hypothetical protein [Thiolinea disciformis]